MKTLIKIITFAVLLSNALGFAQIPQTVSYQGILTDPDGTVVPDDSYSLTFNLYTTTTGGSSIWSETQPVDIANGLFYVILGSVNPLNLPFDQTYYLGITVEEGTELAPRIQMTAAAYSLKARTVADSSIAGASLKNDEIVRSVNGPKDDVFLKAGENISITPSVDSLIISSNGVSTL